MRKTSAVLFLSLSPLRNCCGQHLPCWYHLTAFQGACRDVLERKESKWVERLAWSRCAGDSLRFSARQSGFLTPRPSKSLFEPWSSWRHENQMLLVDRLGFGHPQLAARHASMRTEYLTLQGKPCCPVRTKQMT